MRSSLECTYLYTPLRESPTRSATCAIVSVPVSSSNSSAASSRAASIAARCSRTVVAAIRGMGTSRSSYWHAAVEGVSVIIR